MLDVLEHDTFVSFKLPSEHRQALRRLAASQDRSMSSVLRELVEIALDATIWEGDSEPETPPEPPAKPTPFVRAVQSVRSAGTAQR
jgi:hypothetical protein